jgi:hypothetical protein
MAEEPNVKIINPFDGSEDDLEWLELGDEIPKHVRNPLLYPIGSKIPDPIYEIADLFTNADYLHFTVRVILGIELPPYQVVILDTLWRKKMPMLIGSRGAAKSFILAVYALMRMVLNPGCKIVIVGSGLRQARQVFDYMSWIWERAPVLRDISGRGKTTGPRREVDRFQFEVGDSVCVAIPLGDGTKIRGLRANYIIADEFASIPEEIFNLVVQGFAIVAKEPVQKIKEAATIRKLKRLGQWTPEMEKLRQDRAGGNQVIYSGTAFYAFNHFYKYFKRWHDIIASQGGSNLIKEIFGGDEITARAFNWRDFAVIRLPYTHVPEGMLEPAMLAQAKATLSTAQFNMEYGAIFAADSNGFYKRSVIEAATTNKPILTTDGLIQFSAKKFGDKDKTHVIGVDPAADVDNAAIVVLELNKGHRKIVHCWTTNRKRFNEIMKRMRKEGQDQENDYYGFIAKKIRQLMRSFNTERIVMDKHGGGGAVAEALGKYENCLPSETPVFQLIDPEEPKADDMKEGLHILELVAPTNELNAESNHGMLKDLQEKVLLFPLFDTVELAKAIEIDKLIQDEGQFDTYEDLVQEIEELKSELASITVTPSSSLGKEVFDTPQVKGEGDKKGRLRKDRYSALLYANYYARTRDRNDAFKVEYRAVGGTKDTVKNRQSNQQNGMMYYGPGILKAGMNNRWITQGNAKFIRR